MELINFVLDNNVGISTEEWLEDHNLKPLEDLTDLEISEILLMYDIQKEQL
jgi:hypothetical protein